VPVANSILVSRPADEKASRSSSSSRVHHLLLSPSPSSPRQDPKVVGGAPRQVVDLGCPNQTEITMSIAASFLSFQPTESSRDTP
jgi:hypothetical protein